jgi:bifunctional DNase/RNase
MLRMVVEGIGFDHLKQTVVVLKDWDGRRMLPIWIGPNEAKAIAWELEGVQAPRPASHDLMLSCIRAAKGHVSRVVINDLQDATFFATIDIDTPTGRHHIDARPSDAIALAVRAKCPVFIDGDALEALHDVEPEEEGGRPRISETPPEDDEDAIRAMEREGTPPAPPNFDDPSRATRNDEIERFRKLIGDFEG